MLTSLGRSEKTEVEFAAYLTKPIKPSQLFDALVEVFGGVTETAEMPSVVLDERLAERLPLRILLVEDNAVNQQLALLLLQKIGYRADVAANGVEALEALERQPYDAVLMDVEMPEMDGLEATRRIHQRWPKDRRPHIVAVTANALQGERELCIQAGMDDYITKPIHIEELSGALTRVARRPDDIPSTTSVDVEVVRALVSSLGDEGRGSTGELIGTFLGDAPGRMSRLTAAMEGNDVEGVRREAHTIKTNAATFGAVRLAEFCRELEGAAKAGSLDGGSDLLARISAELGRVIDELGAIHQELR